MKSNKYDPGAPITIRHSKTTWTPSDGLGQRRHDPGGNVASTVLRLGTGEDARLPAAKNLPPLFAVAAVAANLGVPSTPAPGSSRAPTCVQPSLPSAAAVKRPVPTHPAESSGSVVGFHVASASSVVQESPSSRLPQDLPLPAPAAESPASKPAPSSPCKDWWPDDEVAVLNALRLHIRRHDALPHGVDLAMAVFGRFRGTDYSLADLEAKVKALRRWFEDNNAMLCAGSGGPAAGHDLRLYTLSLDVWHAEITNIAAPAPALDLPGKKIPARPVPCRREPALAPKRRRYEEIRKQCPKLAAEVEELMKKALEGINNVVAWSLEMRTKIQQLAGGVRGPGEGADQPDHEPYVRIDPLLI
ncbi:hypothetical protein ACP70R_011758 [Stipagrostis hirtigluma subsp. patula]